MKSSFRSRLEWLEARMAADEPGTFRSGYLTSLPEDYTGERHVVAIKSEPVAGSPGHEWCEFEERSGPEPPGSNRGGFTVYCTR